MMIFVGILFSVLGLTSSYGLKLPDRGGGRIVGGREISITEAPYQVALLHGGSPYCGGEKQCQLQLS